MCRDRIDDWKYEVANGDTMLGYAEWLEHQENPDTCDNDTLSVCPKCGAWMGPDGTHYAIAEGESPERIDPCDGNPDA